METKQQELERLWLVQDTAEVWHTLCRECAVNFGNSNNLVVAVDPLRHTTVKPEYMITPLGVERPETEEVEPQAFEADYYEADMPIGCEECHLWLDNTLTPYGVDYINDPANEMPAEVFELYLGVVKL